ADEGRNGRGEGNLGRAAVEEFQRVVTAPGQYPLVLAALPGAVFFQAARVTYHRAGRGVVGVSQTDFVGAGSERGGEGKQCGGEAAQEGQWHGLSLVLSSLLLEVKSGSKPPAAAGGNGNGLSGSLAIRLRRQAQVRLDRPVARREALAQLGFVLNGIDDHDIFAVLPVAGGSYLVVIGQLQ